jgi:hypothetical protein
MSLKSVARFLSVVLICSAFNLKDVKVFVCDSTTSVAYHETKNCRGLNRCTHEIIQVTKRDAIENYGKRACKICY